MSRVNILGIEFDNYSLEEFKDRLISRLNNKLSTMVVTANHKIVMAANNDPKFMNLLTKNADLITPDGIGIVLGGIKSAFLVIRFINFGSLLAAITISGLAVTTMVDNLLFNLLINL